MPKPNKFIESRLVYRFSSGPKGPKSVLPQSLDAVKKRPDLGRTKDIYQRRSDYYERAYRQERFRDKYMKMLDQFKLDHVFKRGDNLAGVLSKKLGGFIDDNKGDGDLFDGFSRKAAAKFKWFAMYKMINALATSGLDVGNISAGWKVKVETVDNAPTMTIGAIDKDANFVAGKFFQIEYNAAEINSFETPGEVSELEDAEGKKLMLKKPRVDSKLKRQLSGLEKGSKIDFMEKFRTFDLQKLSFDFWIRGDFEEGLLSGLKDEDNLPLLNEAFGDWFKKGDADKPKTVSGKFVQYLAKRIIADFQANGLNVGKLNKVSKNDDTDNKKGWECRKDKDGEFKVSWVDESGSSLKRRGGADNYFGFKYEKADTYSNEPTVKADFTGNQELKKKHLLDKKTELNTTKRLKTAISQGLYWKALCAVLKKSASMGDLKSSFDELRQYALALKAAGKYDGRIPEGNYNVKSARHNLFCVSMLKLKSIRKVKAPKLSRKPLPRVYSNYIERDKLPVKPGETVVFRASDAPAFGLWDVIKMNSDRSYKMKFVKDQKKAVMRDQNGVFTKSA